MPNIGGGGDRSTLEKGAEQVDPTEEQKNGQILGQATAACGAVGKRLPVFFFLQKWQPISHTIIVMGIAILNFDATVVWGSRKSCRLQ